MSNPNATDASIPISTDSGLQLTPTLSTTSPFPYYYQTNDGHYDNTYQQQQQYYENATHVQQPTLSNPCANNDSVVYNYNIHDDFPKFDIGYEESYFDQPGPSGVSFKEPEKEISDLLSSFEEYDKPEEYEVYLNGDERDDLTDLEQYNYEVGASDKESASDLVFPLSELEQQVGPTKSTSPITNIYFLNCLPLTGLSS